MEIDVKELFYEKNPKIAKLLPGFVYWYLRKIIHQDYVNEMIRDYGHLKGYDFSEAMVKYFNLTLTVEGEENLPDSGRFIFVSNHPLGGLDGHVIMYLVGKKYGRDKYKFLVNDLLMNLKNLRDVFIPVNMHGRQGTALAEQMDLAFRSDQQILTFPSGMVSRKIKGRVMDLPWQKSFINKAKQYQRDIIPVHMTGHNSRFFYGLYRVRKFFGIKATIEMVYLVDETLKHRNKHLKVNFGQPISWQSFDKSKTPLEWAAWVKDKVYDLNT